MSTFAPRVAEFLRDVVVPAAAAHRLNAGEPLGELVRDISNIDAILGRCESPIEQLVAAAFQARWGTFGIPEFDVMFGGVSVVTGRAPRIFLLQQFTVPSTHQSVPVRFRLDFALLSFERERPGVDSFRPDGAVRIALECDGHDFHERTAEQAESDRARDRALLADGWTVLRFTGREIWRDPFAVVDEVERFLPARKAVP